MTSRRDFITKAAIGSVATVTAGNSLWAMPATNYRNILGANDRLNVAVAGLGRRVGAYIEPITKKEANVKLLYLCDVMDNQKEKALQNFGEHLDYKIKTETDIRKVLEDKKLDILINSTPDHWHTPGAVMAMQAGKHVYVEKPCSHNMMENSLIVDVAKKYDKVVQMGNQQRSSALSQEIIKEIHNGAIGNPYKALAFYTNSRGSVPNQKKAAVPQGLDWELFQGPAPRREYTRETWDYNWHWYGWDYGTAEAGNNGTHELDVARWALRVDLPNEAGVIASKNHFVDDGWEMYDTMLATFHFDDGKVIQWDGKSRNGYDTYGGGRGTIIYGSEGTVFIDRNKYVLYDRTGKELKNSTSNGNEAGTALGGGGDMTTGHMINFFESVRGKEKLNAPIDDATKSMAMVHYANLAYRTKKTLTIDKNTGKMDDPEAMKLWSREYADGWKPTV